MSVKDILTHMWEAPVFGFVRNIYIPQNRDTKIYLGTYKPDGNPRVLLPRDAIDLLEVKGQTATLSYLLNSILGIFKANMYFASLDDIEESITEVTPKMKNDLREIGKEFYKKIVPIVSNDFDHAYTDMMIFHDLIIGDRHTDIVHRPGLAKYDYVEKYHPFKIGTNYAECVLSLYQGAASGLHDEDMRAIYTVEDGFVNVLSRKESDIPEDEMLSVL